MNAAERIGRITRRAIDARTRFQRAASGLHHLSQQDDLPEYARFSVHYEAEQLLWSVLFNAELVVAALSDEADFDDLEKLARDVQAAHRRRRLAVALAQTEGRTPEEAVAFRAKAKELSDAGR